MESVQSALHLASSWSMREVKLMVVKGATYYKLKELAQVEVNTTESKCRNCCTQSYLCVHIISLSNLEDH